MATEVVRRKRRKRNFKEFLSINLIKIKFIALVIFFLLCCLCATLTISGADREYKIAPETELETEVETEPETEAVTEPETEAVTETETESEIEAPKLSAEGPGELYYYNLSDEDKIYIAKVIYREARGECFEGQVAVAAVVLNRYTSDNAYYDNESIYDVVTQPKQFADIACVTAEDLGRYPDCIRAVEAACKGWDPTREVFPEGARFFFSLKGLSEEAAAQREYLEVMKIGNHYFHLEF